MAGHTKGPWRWDGHSLVSDADGLNHATKYVIELHDGWVYSEHSADAATIDVTPDNARLIAAAPCLLDALMMAECYVAIEGSDEELKLVQDAIAKATQS